MSPETIDTIQTIGAALFLIGSILVSVSLVMLVIRKIMDAPNARTKRLLIIGVVTCVIGFAPFVFLAAVDDQGDVEEEGAVPAANQAAETPAPDGARDMVDSGVADSAGGAENTGGTGGTGSAGGTGAETSPATGRDAGRPDTPYASDSAFQADGISQALREVG